MVEGKIQREHIATVGDLIALREDLIREIGKLLKSESTEQSVRWMKSAQVKKLLGISFGTLHSLRIKGALRFSRVGRIIFYDSKDIDKLLSENSKV